jgi:hypothetical protein
MADIGVGSLVRQLEIGFWPLSPICILRLITFLPANDMARKCFAFSCPLSARTDQWALQAGPRSLLGTNDRMHLRDIWDGAHR